MTASWLDKYGSPAPNRPTRTHPTTTPPTAARVNPLAPAADRDIAVARTRAMTALIRRHRVEYRELLAAELAEAGS